MKQLLSLFLFLIPCLAWAQYPSNGNQKITLGEQTTADGLIYRGVLGDTALITPLSDTSAYIILDTVNNRFFHYKRNTNIWSIAGGSDTSLIAYVNTYGAQTVNGAKTLTSNLILKNSQEPTRSTFLSQQTFTADTTDWTRGTGWTFNGTQAAATAASGDLTYTPALTITNGNAYEITYTITGYSSGTLTARIGNVLLALPTQNITGNVILLLPTSATGGFRFTTSSFTGNLDNVSIVEITGTAPVIFAGQDDGSATLYNSLRMPTTTTLAFGGGGARTTGVGNNVFIGNNAGSTNTTGSNNYFFGPSAGLSNTTGSNNVFIGLNAGQLNTIGVSNTFIGNSAGVANTTGTSNNFIGTSAGRNNLTGSNNFMFGTEAGQFNTTGSTNIFFGVAAGRNNLIGTNNIFFGLSSGRNSKGSYNISIGDNALYNTIEADSLTGNSNIAIGLNAADNITGAAAGNVAIGNSIDLPINNGSNQVVIKNIIFATGASGTGTTIAGNVGIGTNAPTSRLVVKGSSNTSSTSSLNITNSFDVSLLNVRDDGLVTLGTPLPLGSGGTGSLTKNFVDLTTTQTVAGAKTFTGNLGVGIAAPTAKLHLNTGTTSVAPLKFTSGTNLTTAEAGAMEFNGTNLFFSPSTTRHTVNHGLTGSANLDFASTTAQNSRDMTIAITGAADGDVVSLGVPNAAVNANTSYSAWVSSSGTVTVRFNNYSSGTVDPTQGFFKVFVTK
jgi:hypothetical protein